MEFLDKIDFVLFDIETSGLDPRFSMVRAYGMANPATQELELKGAEGPSRERELLSSLITKMILIQEIGGWNITEFDLAFLAARASMHDLNFPIGPATDDPQVGKYGNPRFTVVGRGVMDLAYTHGEQLAKELGVRWSLQPVVEALGWKPSITMTGADAANAPLARVLAHCLDDLEAMLHLYKEIKSAL